MRFFIFVILLSGCGGADFTLQQQEDGGVEALSTGRGTGGATDKVELPSEDAGAGGADGTGGSGGSVTAPDAGGDACVLVTHSNGLGQTWQDCTPLGTYNEEEALKACKASVSTQCFVLQVCGDPLYLMRGYNVNGVPVGNWGYGGPNSGHVGLFSASGQELGTGCSGGQGSSTWN